MADPYNSTPTSPLTPSPQPEQLYWCYNCDKRVTVHPLTTTTTTTDVTTSSYPDVICSDCHFTFLEPLPPDSSHGDPYLHILRHLPHLAFDDHAPPSPPPPPPPPRPNFDTGDILRIEISAFDDNDDDRFTPNPNDYDYEYETLLRNLADVDDDSRKGAPPAAKSAVENLQKALIELKDDDKEYTCAICKEVVNLGEIVSEMPCGHGYHGGCIVAWLGLRNSCPICRFELPTDDPEYEEQRRLRCGNPNSSMSSV